MPIFPLGQAGTFQRQGCHLDIRQTLCDLCQDEISLCGEIKCPTLCIWKSIRGECSDVMTKPKLSCFSLGWLTLCLRRAVWMKKKYLGQLTQSIFSPWSFPILSWSETKGFAISAELPTMREKVSLWLDLVGLVWTTQATYRQHSIVAEEAEMCFGCSDRWSLRGPSVSYGDSNYWTAERGAREDAPTLCCWIFPLSRVFMCTWEWIVLTYQNWSFPWWLKRHWDILCRRNAPLETGQTKDSS